MEPDRETLNAFVDGELPPEQMETIANLLATRPDLDRYVREQEHLRTVLRQSYPADAPIPQRLIAAVQTAPVSWRWRLRNWLTNHPVRSFLPAGAALATGLTIGFLLQPIPEYGTDAAGRLVAQGELAESLTTRLAATGQPASGPRIGISFRNKSGHDCRTFTSGREAGLACRDGGDWMIAMLVSQAGEHPGAEYRMAGSEMPDAVRRAVAASIDGTPFDAAMEKQARERGWSGR